MYILRILPDTAAIAEKYATHKTYHAGDSGIDLFVPEDTEFCKGHTHFLNLGIKCEMLDDMGKNVSYFLYPRSSISKTPLRLANSVGIIDAGYRGNIIAALDVGKDFSVKENDRLVQICAPNLGPIGIEVVSELSNTERGEGGFGSTQ